MAQSLRQFFCSSFRSTFIGGLLFARPPVRKYCALFNLKKTPYHTRIFQFCTRSIHTAAMNICVSSIGFTEGFKAIKLGFEKETLVRTVPIKSIFRFPCFENIYSIRQSFDFFFKRMFSKIGLSLRCCAHFIISPISLDNLWGINMFNFTHEGFDRRFFPKFNHIFNIKISIVPRLISISREG